MEIYTHPFCIFLILLTALFQSCAVNPEVDASEDNSQLGKVVTANEAMVVYAHPEASQVGLAILQKGGNAIDAMVGTHFALAVVYPSAGNIGGGGSMVLRQENGDTHTLDFREKAPGKAHPA